MKASSGIAYTLIQQTLGSVVTVYVSGLAKKISTHAVKQIELWDREDLKNVFNKVCV
ncbi:MAG: hypothetical protein F6J86_19815 [Symploca sp. SIO1B1]|nr:hypothetical protein [Symploca sp. SIO1C2]NER96059.1 hypothetical protein [Symploca sp. SIO1B1]